ncbi:MAG: DUF3788 family protein [Enterococcus sp.]
MVKLEKEQWLRSFNEMNEPTIPQAVDFSPAGTYFLTLMKQLVRHYEPDFRWVYSKEKSNPGWCLLVEKKEQRLATIYFQDHSFSVLCAIDKRYDDTLIKPMAVVMSDEFQRIYAHAKTIRGNIWFLLEVVSEREMEDAMYLISIRVRKLRLSKK